jgi:hypothetical protein
MDFEKALERFRKDYGKLGFEWIESNPRELIFEPQIKGYDIKMLISEDEINEYANFLEMKDEFVLKPVECSICSMDYREHILESAGDHYLTNIFIKRQVPTTLIDPNSDSSVEIGPASMNFVNYFRFEAFYQTKFLDNMYQRLYHMIKENHYSLRMTDPLDLRDFLFKPTTIKLYNLKKIVGDEDIDSVINISSEIINACLLRQSCDDINSYHFKIADKWSPERGNNIPNYHHHIALFNPFSPNIRNIPQEITLVFG